MRLRNYIIFGLLLCTMLLAGRLATLSFAKEPAAAPSDAGMDDTICDVIPEETFYLSRTLDYTMAQARQRVVAELTAEKFAVLTEIDLQAKFKEKLDKDIPPYVILGACGAGFAHKGYLIDEHIGVLLPCNVVLREVDGGKVEVLIRNPHGLAQANPALDPVGQEVFGKMQGILDRL